MTMRPITAALAVLGLAAAPLPALAQASLGASDLDSVVVEAEPFADGEARTSVVDYADLDLGRDAGVATLLERIDRAAATVCADAAEPGVCSDAAADRAVETVALDHPLVADRYAALG